VRIRGKTVAVKSKEKARTRKSGQRTAVGPGSWAQADQKKIKGLLEGKEQALEGKRSP